MPQAVDEDEGFLEYEEGMRAECLAECEQQLPGASVQPESIVMQHMDADSELIPHSELSAGCKQLAVVEDKAYDYWLRQQPAGPYKDVVDPHPAAEGRPRLGEFHILVGTDYGAKMCCKLPGHRLCFRMRKWRRNQGEQPSAVDRVLVSWQLQGCTVKVKAGQSLAEAHMALPKY